jgi:heptosyltransferase-2
MLREQKNKIQNIMVRPPNWIGDAVMATPAMGAIRATFPDARITVVANPTVAELLSPHPYCDRAIVLDKRGAERGPWGFFRFCMMLGSQKFDLAILLQNAIEAAIMARLSGVGLRAGFSTDGRGFLLTHPVPVGKEEKALHHTDYYLQMARGLGICGGDGRLRLQCTDPEIAWAERTLSDQGTWVAFNPGAAYGSAKRWLPDRFAATADAISQEYGAGVLILGSTSEAQLCLDIQRLMCRKPLNMAGKTSVRQLMALLSRSNLLVTNDSGPMHVAAALGIPIVALFGPTDHKTTSPLGNSSLIVRKSVACAPCLKRECPTDHRCMDEITVEDALAAVREMMRHHPRALVSPGTQE